MTRESIQLDLLLHETHSLTIRGGVGGGGAGGAGGGGAGGAGGG